MMAILIGEMMKVGQMLIQNTQWLLAIKASEEMQCKYVIIEAFFSMKATPDTFWVKQFFASLPDLHKSQGIQIWERAYFGYQFSSVF